MENIDAFHLFFFALLLTQQMAHLVSRHLSNKGERKREEGLRNLFVQREEQIMQVLAKTQNKLVSKDFQAYVALNASDEQKPARGEEEHVEPEPQVQVPFTDQDLRMHLDGS